MTGLTNRQKKIKAKKVMDYLDKVFPNVECELLLFCCLPNVKMSMLIELQ